MNEIGKIISLYREAGVKTSDTKPYTVDEQMNKIASVFAPGKHYFYILNFHNLAMDYVTPSVKDVLNISPEEFSLEKYLCAIHPDYLMQVYKNETRIVEFVKSPDITNITNFKFCYFIKFRLPNGDFRHILHQSIVVTNPNNLTIKYVLGIDMEMPGYKIINDSTLSPTPLKKNLNSFHMIYANQEIRNPNSTSSIGNVLSEREMEIVKHLSDGNSTKMIAQKLYISEYTVCTHRKNILQKTKSTNTAELVKKYILETGASHILNGENQN